MMESATVFVGLGYGTVAPSTPIVPAKPTDEYVAASRTSIGPYQQQGLSPSIDSITRQHGWAAYDAMMCDAVVESSFDVLRLGALSGGMKIPPTHPEVQGDPPTPEQARSREIADFCDRLVKGLKRPLLRTLWEALEMMAYGNKLAEKVYRLEKFGPDKGRLMLDLLKFKPHWSWLFVVDSKLNLLSIMAWTPDRTGVSLLPVGKFAIFTWGDRNGDPRGTSILRSAYEAWNQKVLSWPQYERFRRKFGTPVPIGKTPKGANPVPRLDKATGRPIPGTIPLSAQEAMAETLAAWQEGNAIAVPEGCDVDLAEPTSNGEVFTTSHDLFNREIRDALLKAGRTTGEAQHGSKADSETAQDVTGLVIAMIRELLAVMVRDQIFYDAVALNFGEEDAHAYTPLPTFGQTEQQDFAKVAQAVALLWKAGYLTDSQKAALDARLGIPQAKPGECATRPGATMADDEPSSESGADPKSDPADDKPPAKKEKAKP